MDDDSLQPDSSPLFVPQSSYRRPGDLTYSNSPVFRNGAKHTNEANRQPHSPGSFASLASTRASAGSTTPTSNSSTPHSIFSMNQHGNSRTRSRQFTSRDQDDYWSDEDIFEGPSKKRRRTEGNDRNSSDASGSRFDVFNDDFESHVSNRYRAAQPEVIDLTEPSPVNTHSRREVQAARGLESLGRSHGGGRQVKFASDDTRARDDGTVTAPICIEDLETPVGPKAASPRRKTSSLLPPKRESSIEIIEAQEFQSRLQAEAVAAQSNTKGHGITTFNNMTCAICMDVPRNLSMVPCGKSHRTILVLILAHCLSRSCFLWSLYN